MTEVKPVYQGGDGDEGDERRTPLPARALKLAWRLLQMEQKAGGRARVTVEVVMVDGQWLMWVSQPGEMERLGE